MTGWETNALGAAVKLTEGVFRSLRQRIFPDTSRAALDRLTDDLADNVRRREEQLRDQLLGGPGTAMDLTFRTGSGRTAVAAKADCGSWYRGLVSPRRLVVLGEAGSGKTVLVNNLMLDQLTERASTDQQRSNTPVPVRVSLASWNGSEAFTDWLRRRLCVDYGLHDRVAEKLLDDRHRILPVLDGGLDEMDPPGSEPRRADRALDWLNNKPWAGRPVIVTCRTEVFNRVQESRGDGGLYSANVMTLQPLSPVEITERLQHYRVDEFRITDPEAWAPVTDQIRDHPRGPLATALRSPWLLSLTTAGLRRGAPNAVELSRCSDNVEVENALFAALIPAATAGEPTRRTRTYTEDNVRTWLRTLAIHLDRQHHAGIGGDQIRLDQIWQLAARPSRLLHGTVIGVIFAIVFEASCAPGTDVASRIAGGLLLLAFGVLGGVVAESRGTIYAQHPAWQVPGRSRWRHGMATGAAAGIVVGLVMGFMIGVGNGHTVGIKAGLAFGLVCGLVAGFWDGLSTNSQDRLALGQDARRLIRGDAAFTLALGGALWVGCAVAVGFTFGAVEGLKVAPWGALIALMMALNLATGRYAATALVFRCTGGFVCRPARFFEWARDAGLLRVNGPAYQFRHGTYQYWLATDGAHDGAPAQRSTRPKVDVS